MDPSVAVRPVVPSGMRPLAPIYRHIGSRLRVLRNTRELTQSELAEAIGRGTEYVGKVERGEKRIQLEDLGRLWLPSTSRSASSFRASPLAMIRARGARERASKWSRVGRTSRALLPDEVTTLTQLVAALDQADVAALIAVAQRMFGAGLHRR